MDSITWGGCELGLKDGLPEINNLKEGGKGFREKVTRQ
jgi:hypothetical protein